MTTLRKWLRADAVLSDDGRYRYSLTREWSWSETPARRCLFVMLNPSTADAETDDPTMVRVMNFADREGYEAVDVVNLFAYRATSPRDLQALAADRDGRAVLNGPENDRHIQEAAARASLVVLAWGAWFGVKFRGAKVSTMIRYANREVPIKCLGTTAAGHPRHPLYLPANAPLIDWKPAA